jgi:hypothetical protein
MSFPTKVKSTQNAPILRPHDFVNINSLLTDSKKRSSSKKSSSRKPKRSISKSSSTSKSYKNYKIKSTST